MSLIQEKTGKPGKCVTDKSGETSLTAPVASARLRLRTFLVAIPLVIALCVLSVYADNVSRVVQFGVLQLAPPAVVALLGLALINKAVARLTKKSWLSAAELITIYAMSLLAVMISTRGLIEKLIPALAYLPYYSTRENRWNELLTQHIPAWAVPYTPSAAVTGPSPEMRAFYEGGTPIPWNVWLGPLCSWGVLLFCVVTVFGCLATLLRRQWMDNEQLRFPLTTLPLALATGQSEGEPFFANRLMWSGFLLSAGVFAINGLAANYPDFPVIPTSLDTGQYLSERPFNMMNGMPIFLSFAALGFAYFLPLDLLFSFWFFFVMSRVQDVVMVGFGGLPTGIGTHASNIWQSYQAAGAYVVLAFAQLRIGWPYYKAVFKTAFGRNAPGQARPLDDSSELVPYRTAIIGLLLGFGGIILWLTFAGMSPLLAFAQMGIYIFFIALIMSRGVAEGGLLMTETSFLPAHLIALVYPLPSLGAANLTWMAMTNTVFARDLRGILLSPLMDAQKMAKETGLRARSLLLPLSVAIGISVIAAAYSFLSLNYHQGALSLYDYPRSNANWMVSAAASQANGSSPVPGGTEYGGFGLGIVVTVVLVWARSSFSWFPFHPLAYALCSTWAMMVLWFPCLLAWIIKSLIMRFGGIDSFRKVAPFMLGLILGEFSAAVFWSLGNILRGWNAPNFPWP